MGLCNLSSYEENGTGYGEHGRENWGKQSQLNSLRGREEGTETSPEIVWASD